MSAGPDRLAWRRLCPVTRSPRRRADLNIVIRTAVLTDEGPHAGAGGAMVVGSELVEEYEEMLLKAATSLRVPLAATSGQDAASATERAVPARAAEGGLR
ncbi:chorismate-binding protein [Streptomyces caniscabiei]|uniref:chorismate-binding protein n=1 Tax=Streptomyces caniscabiei TaxID=2746961 RepID=UPI0029C0D4F2|nr:chorismate-binding protein [Streptomyces caniscabiei]